MTVFLISAAERFGGAEVYLAGLAHELVRARCEVTIACGRFVAEKLRERLRGDSIDIWTDDAIVWDWTKSPATNCDRQAEMYDRLRRQFGSFTPFVNLNWLSVGTGLLRAIAEQSQRAIVHVHLCPHTVFLSDEEKKTLSRSIGEDTWSTVSADNRRFIARSLDLDASAENSRIDVIYNGAINTGNEIEEVDVASKRAARARLDLPLERPIILSVGRHNTQKGFEEALTAMQRLQPLVSNIMYLWVGGGELFERHQQMVIEAGLEEHVQLLSERPGLADLYRSADLFYMPTKYEGFSLAMLEAAFYGLPIVVNDISSAREFIPIGFESCLVPPLRVWEHVWRLYDFLQEPETLLAIGKALQKQGRLFTQSAMYETMRLRIEEAVT